MILENILDTSNMVVGRLTKFLLQFEVHFHSPKPVFPIHGDPEMGFQNFKNPTFFTFTGLSQD